MNKKTIIKELIANFHGNPVRATKDREIHIPLDIEKIVVLTGARRAGKTCLLLNTIQRLTQEIPIEKVVYINFEDERLSLSSRDLDLILQSYQELYPDFSLDTCYFFFDEIQEVDGWEKFVRRCDDTVSRHIYLTGSNAKLLGSEIATSLRGRALRFEIFPLSFREYLDFAGIEAEYFSSANRAKIINAFGAYLKFGGFPEITRIRDEEIILKILQEYYDVMIVRDILERYGQPNIHGVKYFLKRLVESIKTPVSVSKIHNELKSMGFRIGKNTVYDYLYYAESVYFSFTAYKYGRSIKRRQLAEKKSYIIDNGFLTALTHGSDYGKKLENLVAIELKRRNHDLFFAKNGKECDFIVAENNLPIQVCADISSPQTFDREIQGAVFGARLLGSQDALIITLDEERRMDHKGIRIHCIPAWKFCLDADWPGSTGRTLWKR